MGASGGLHLESPEGTHTVLDEEKVVDVTSWWEWVSKRGGQEKGKAEKG